MTNKFLLPNVVSRDYGTMYSRGTFPVGMRRKFLEGLLLSGCGESFHRDCGEINDCLLALLKNVTVSRKKLNFFLERKSR